MATGITVRPLILSSFALDGGAMHGIVPRPLWERIHPADAQNRIPSSRARSSSTTPRAARAR